MFRQAIFGSCKNQLRGAAKRFYSSPSLNKPDYPKFKYLALVALISTGIFVQAVSAIDKNAPKESFSEEEFQKMSNSIIRKVAMFPDGDIDVSLVPRNSYLKTSNYNSAKIIDVETVIEYFRKFADDKYEALLNETYDNYKDEYFYRLPKGMPTMLLGKYMKQKCQKGDKVIVCNFPDSIDEAIKFEKEVSVVSNIFINKDTKESDLAVYYGTVDKVRIV